MKETPDIEKIMICFDDGTQKEIHKGFIAGMKVDESKGEACMTFNMCHMSGAEMKYIVNGIVEFGLKTGLLGNGDETNEKA